MRLTRKNKDKLLLAKRYGFYADVLDYWSINEFVIDYDIFEEDFCLRSLNKNNGLGQTRFWLKDYGKTWALTKKELL